MEPRRACRNVRTSAARAVRQPIVFLFDPPREFGLAAPDRPGFLNSQGQFVSIVNIDSENT